MWPCGQGWSLGRETNPMSVRKAMNSYSLGRTQHWKPLNPGAKNQLFSIIYTSPHFKKNAILSIAKLTYSLWGKCWKNRRIKMSPSVMWINMVASFPEFFNLLFTLNIFHVSALLSS